MKKIFAIFCAIVLMPSFSAHAWIGGPFGGNNYFGPAGDDGIWEAAASIIPGSVRSAANPGSGTVLFGSGTYRWGVENNQGTLALTNLNTSLDDLNFDTTTQFIPAGTPAASNTFFGGFSGINHVWFINGIAYFGTCVGTANSGLGGVFASGFAQSPAQVASEIFVDSFFSAAFLGSGNAVPARGFEGFGQGTLNSGSNTDPDFFEFTVFGSKVSNSLTYGGGFLN